MDASSITAVELRQALQSSAPPIVIDVRRDTRFLEAVDVLRGALRRDPARVADWAGTLPRASPVVVYCVHGHEVSQQAAAELRTAGVASAYLEGGIEGWRAAGGNLFPKPAGASTRWVTRERPKIDRIACPWLVSRAVDPGAEFLYVPTPSVRAIAKERGAVPYDVADVDFTHVGERCSFDAFIDFYRLGDPALAELATIVRGADTDRLDLAPQRAGLAAVSLGLSRNFADDHAMLAQGMVVYDALYRWCREGKPEVHTWNPEATR
jgi:rhodanese-related sulfurtransferase